MRPHRITTLFASILLASSMGCSADQTGSVGSNSTSPIDSATGYDNWERYGGDWTETHYSPLKQINDANIDRLGLLWSFDLPTMFSSGVSAPLAVDGVLYFAVGWSVIHAVDALSGKLLWQYNPEVHKHGGSELRSAWGVRGIAYADGKILSGTADGRLIAVDATSGELVWQTQTTGDNDHRSITGVPYVMNDKVIIGHGGADFGPVRGYVTAYHIDSGAQAWRFYTVPGNPADGFENEAMEMAAKTWTGEWWKHGGGGTVWHAMAYDQEFNRIYIGVGNGAPWNQKIRSPDGGDNLFLASIVALDADSGEYIWHYQVNPGETWDYTASQDILLADLILQGETRKVILHAPKNGFFYVLDRVDGSLISAEPFTAVSWAERIDLETGRPVEVPGARFPDGSHFFITPNAFGGHGVEAMSFNPITGLAYIPARQTGSVYIDPADLPTWKHNDDHHIQQGLGSPPPYPDLPAPEGWLAAWNPETQQEAWRVEQESTHNGGTLTTAGNLVIQGQASGEISIYAADSGNKIWSFDARNGIMAQPISYAIDDQQYISLLVGWRRTTHMGIGPKWNYRTQERRLLTFALGADAKLPEPTYFEPPIVQTAGFAVDDAKADAGQTLYHQTCYICHGANLESGGGAPDLARSAFPGQLSLMVDVLHNGLLAPQGMPPYPNLSTEEIEQLQHYLIRTTREKESNVAETAGGNYK